MRKKLFVTLLMMVSIILTGSAYKKASNGYVKESRVICIMSEESSNKNERTKDFLIKIFDNIKRSYSWNIVIVIDNDTVLSGDFTLRRAEKKDGNLYFRAEGINEKTREEMELSIVSNDQQTTLSFKSPEEGVKLNMPRDTFVVNKDNPETKIYFNRALGYFSFPSTDRFQSWRTGTTKQLKMRLSQNPYIKEM